MQKLVYSLRGYLKFVFFSVDFLLLLKSNHESCPLWLLVSLRKVPSTLFGSWPRYSYEAKNRSTEHEFDIFGALLLYVHDILGRFGLLALNIQPSSFHYFGNMVSAFRPCLILNGVWNQHHTAIGLVSTVLILEYSGFKIHPNYIFSEISSATMLVWFELKWRRPDRKRM